MQRAIQCSNYRGQESKEQFAVYDSNTPVTLKQGQGHQTWYEWLDPEQGHIQSLKDLPYTVSPQKPMLKFLSNQKTCQLPPLNVCKKRKIVVYPLST